MFPGTVTIPVDTLRDFSPAAARSYLRPAAGGGAAATAAAAMTSGAPGAKSVVFLACHSINIRAADAACRILAHEGQRVAVIDWWKTVFGVADDLVESENSPKGHGGEVITSVTSAVRPDLVRFERSVHERPKEGLAFHGPHTLTGGGPFYTYGDFTDYCESGAWGSTDKAGPEKGRILIERAVRAILPFLAKLSSPLREP
jgi:creatinine amidohydrolase/Fe(II)-dependent formamide hydrolase-like protein